jgi:hypothetical protein
LFARQKNALRRPVDQTIISSMIGLEREEHAAVSATETIVDLERREVLSLLRDIQDTAPIVDGLNRIIHEEVEVRWLS